MISGSIDANGPTRSDWRELLLAGTPLLDVRAPVEFARGALPGAINIPLMDDEERHQVGLRYKQAGQDEAIALGARLIAPEERQRRAGLWTAFATAHPDGALYCFRGGLRSRITQQWMRDAGCVFPRLAGGYKQIRTALLSALPELLAQLPVTLIGGRTGVGKTVLLQQLPRQVDLEGLAKHRGSSFGATEIAQPSNIDFEHAVTLELMRLHQQGATAMVYLEDEARMIGRVCMPEPMRSVMQQAPLVILDEPLELRVQHALTDYVQDLLQRYQTQHEDTATAFSAYASHHRSSLQRISKRLGGSNTQQAMALLDHALERHQQHGELGSYVPFIELLLTRYYDPMYDYQIAGKRARIVFQGRADDVIQWVLHASQGS